MPSTPQEPEELDRATILTTAIHERYDGNPRDWLVNHFRGPDGKGVARSTAANFLDPHYVPGDIPRIAILRPLADQLRIPRKTMLLTWGREVDMVNDQPNHFAEGLDPRTATLDGNYRRKGHRLITGLCDEAELAAENKRLRALLQEHGIDAD